MACSGSLLPNLCRRVTQSGKFKPLFVVNSINFVEFLTSFAAA